MAARFSVTLAANLVRAGLSFLSGMLVARSLGAAHFGDLNFLIVSFTAMNQLVDLGSSSAFYTFVSKAPRTQIFFAKYALWLAVQFALTLLVATLVLPDSARQLLWLGHSRGTIVLALAASFLSNQVWLTVSQLGEAARRTFAIQLASVVQAVAHALLILGVQYYSVLTVSTVLVLLASEYAVLTIIVAPSVIAANRRDTAEVGNPGFRDFWQYCRPLALYTWVGFVCSFGDRWLLQRFGGSEQQGYFAIGQQFAAVSLLATTSVLRVFWKEIAEANARNDLFRVRELFSTTTRALYFVGCWISCLLIPHSRALLEKSVGAEYTEAALCLALMFIYPVHQALGQIQGTFMFATEKTGTYARVGLLTMLASLPLSYLILADSQLGWGAVGLAEKIVLVQIITVNIQAFLIAKDRNWSLDIAYQVLIPAVLFPIAFAAKFVAQVVVAPLQDPANLIVIAGFAAAIYAAGTACVIMIRPELVGFRPQQVRLAWATTAGVLRGGLR